MTSLGKIDICVRWSSVFANLIGIPSDGQFHSNTLSIIWVYHVVDHMKHCQCRVVVPNFTYMKHWRCRFQEDISSLF